ncbi:hypothetical protein M3Y99_00134700 [Aphelenchoides fujianensis]|nr:hypothetical protein M3Y99_00134700 [Aphelenchoides fujianensis]
MHSEETLKLAALWGVWCSNGRLEVPECECESRIRAAYAEAKEELPQKADVPEYEMQFTKLTIRYDLQRSKIKAW